MTARVPSRRQVLVALVAAGFSGLGDGRAADAFSEENVRLDTGSGTLEGTLLAPRTDKAVPVAVLVAGSGPTDRDGNSAVGGGLRNDSLRLLAQGLAQQGIATLRYDKRGVGASRAAAPLERDLRFDHYVDDAAAWVKRLAADRRFQAVGLVGHSEGALISMLAAARAPAAWLVSLASPAVGAAELLRQQLRGRLPPALAQESDRILASLLEGKLAAGVPPELNVLYRDSVQPYLISWFPKVPADELAKLTIPRLIVQGTTDAQVPLEQAQRLKAACGPCELAIVEGMNHVLKPVSSNPAAQAASHSDPTLPLAPGLTEAITTFIRTAPPTRR
jgi:uncharacterized protein